MKCLTEEYFWVDFGLATLGTLNSLLRKTRMVEFLIDSGTY